MVHSVTKNGRSRSSLRAVSAICVANLSPDERRAPENEVHALRGLADGRPGHWRLRRLRHDLTVQLLSIWAAGSSPEAKEPTEAYRVLVGRPRADERVEDIVEPGGTSALLVGANC